MPTPPEKLIQKHGGYRKLKSFQLAELIFDLSIIFCDKYIDKRSRTHDQMVQAARSGRQNIGEGSQCSGTSKKFEIKLTGVARASLEELTIDYEDFLRQRGYPLLEPEDPILQRFKEMRCKTVGDVRVWVKDERERMVEAKHFHHTDEPQSPHSVSPCGSSVLPSSALAANGILSLLNLCTHFLDRQLERQSQNFEDEGGFTERLYRIRKQKRRQ